MKTLFRLAIAAIAISFALPSQAADDDVTPQQRYEAGLRYMRRGNYTKALEQFNRIRNFHRDDPLAIQAELAIADVQYEKSEYEEARLAYEDFSRLHPRHHKLDYVVYRIGQCLFARAPKVATRDQTPTRQAVNVWTGFEARFPDSPFIKEVSQSRSIARERLAGKELAIARFYAKRGAWLAARHRAEDLVRRYPDAASAAEALAIAAEGYHAWGLETEARAAREQLATLDSRSPRLADVDRLLATPAGAPPKDEIFPRPVRVAASIGPSTATPPPQ